MLRHTAMALAGARMAAAVLRQRGCIQLIGRPLTAVAASLGMLRWLWPQLELWQRTQKALEATANGILELVVIFVHVVQHHHANGADY